MQRTFVASSTVVLCLVCTSGFVEETEIVQQLCLSFANACREELPCTLLVARGMPWKLLWWHLMGGERTTLP